MNGELNPNHPVTKEMRELWYKALALLMREKGMTEFEITSQMVADFPADSVIVADARFGKLVLRIMGSKEAEAFLRSH